MDSLNNLALLLARLYANDAMILATVASLMPDGKEKDRAFEIVKAWNDASDAYLTIERGRTEEE